jgi:hypothetical protein
LNFSQGRNLNFCKDGSLAETILKEVLVVFPQSHVQWYHTWN